MYIDTRCCVISCQRQISNYGFQKYTAQKCIMSAHCWVISCQRQINDYGLQ